MTDGPDNLILRLLRRIDLNAERITEDVCDIKVWLTAVDEGLVGRATSDLLRLKLRVDRIDRRFDLVALPH